MTIPNIMRAIIVSEPGDPEVMRWLEAPTPAPTANEVLIRVAAAGLNRADILQRKGKYPPPEGASSIMGMEVSGTVVALGSAVKRWKIGDKVCALLAGGGYAEYCVAHEKLCLPIPEKTTLNEAATLLEGLTTVWANLFEDGKLGCGKTALVHGGSSGIGSFAIQLGKIFGAKIFVTAGDENKCNVCRKLGADLAINYKTQDFVESVQQATKGQGVDVILDMIGGDYLNRNLSVLAQQGRHVSIATQQGAIASVDIRMVMAKRLMITGSTLRGRSIIEKARLITLVEKNLWHLISENQLKPLIDNIFPIKLVSEAHKKMESSQHIGKIVLEVQAAL